MITVSYKYLRLFATYIGPNFIKQLQIQIAFYLIKHANLFNQ